MAGDIARQITQTVASWPGVTVEPHRFGGVEFRVGRRALGHPPGARLAALPFPVKVRDELIAAGKADRHHVLPESGWISRWIRGVDDVSDVVDLFRLNYEHPWSAKARERPLPSASISNKRARVSLARDRSGHCASPPSRRRLTHQLL